MLSKSISLIALFLSLMLYIPIACASSEIAGFEGTMKADYAEKTDTQTASLSGNNRTLAYRAKKVLSFLDLGLEWGTYAISGQSRLHESELSSDYVNLILGVSFRLSPSWLEYTLDLGYRLGVDRMKIDRTTSNGVDRNKIGGLSQQPFGRFGIRAFLGENLFVGVSTEQQNSLFDKSEEGLEPTVRSGNTTSLILGYRFGGQDYWRAPIRSGKSRSLDPCLLHRVCDPS